MRIILLFVFTISSFLSKGQTFNYPSVIATGNQLSDFLPNDWIVLDSTKGDLNKDGFSDAAIILQHKDSITLVKSNGDTVVTQPRMLVILFKDQTNNRYHLVERSNSFILNHETSDMDDPYSGLRITNGVLQIDFHLFYNIGSWFMTNVSYKFYYRNSQFELIGADYHSFHRATQDFEEYSYNFLTKRRSFSKGNDSDNKKKTYWKRLNIGSLKTLKDLHEPFTWEVEKDFYL
jgi:hypothetical protein